ncbi:MAG: CRISPR-associated endonuclease/helicase Cas3 [Halioglobus sp.]|jgi:CRISPR-associated endonuclease/helicase Cas3
MKSFKSFDELLLSEKKIEDVLINYERYHAHTHKTKSSEKLHEHVHLVMDYASKLVKAQGLDLVLDSLILDFMRINSSIEKIDQVGNYVKKLFVNALVYHDYGKVNENFQREKMKSTFYTKSNHNNHIGSKHSILSAYMFICIHLREITESDNFAVAEQNFLILAIYLFANPILKHHSSQFEHYVDFSKELSEGLRQYLGQYQSEITTEVEFLLVNSSKVIDKCMDGYLDSGESYFSAYAMLKLNFSLLTASDYYATNDFMSNMKVSDFGLIDENLKSQLFKNFTNNKDAEYNKKLYKDLDKHYQLDFEEVRERSESNLNKLRQKMAAEAIVTLRENIDQKLFYLEAPTGGGKTNMSFACALELLKSDESLNKVFYVFPFTTLITQTFRSIKETLQIDDDKVIQLHSKGGFHTSRNEKDEDGLYGDRKLNYINNLFINYPFTLLSHIKFFNVLKGNRKDDNYILHRLSNSVVVIDELQTYDPKHWDKIIFFLHHYSKHFNIRFIIMSATLPKIDQLSLDAVGSIQALIPNKHKYFNNKNFKGRIDFDFSLLGKSGRETIELDDLLDKVHYELEIYAASNGNKSNGLIEFIIKKSASSFYKLATHDVRFEDYKMFLISGTILEPRRKEIIDAIKEKKYTKTLVVSTQVIEAGVDIDMDVGFKDRSIVDSDEQLAGRVNRNAKKRGCKVFMFNYDREHKIYGGDLRYKQRIVHKEYKSILEDKNFDVLYNRVNKEIIELNKSVHFQNLHDYIKYLRVFNFKRINDDFKLIDSDTTSVYIPLNIERQWFTVSQQRFLDSFGDDHLEVVRGEQVFDIYLDIIKGDADFTDKTISKKQIGGIMSNFMFSIFTDSKLNLELLSYSEYEYFNKFGIIYLRDWNEVYDYEDGIKDDKFEESYVIL